MEEDEEPVEEEPSAAGPEPTPVVVKEPDAVVVVEPVKPKKKKAAATRKPKATQQIQPLADPEPDSAPTTAPPSPTAVRPPLTPLSTNSPHHSFASLAGGTPSTPKAAPVLKAYVPGVNPFSAPLDKPTEEDRALTLEQWYDQSGRREQVRLAAELGKGIVEFETGVEVARQRLQVLVAEARERVERARRARA